MLWESADPAEELPRRFGFADAAAAVGWLSELLRERWAVRLRGCARIMLSDRNALALLETDAGPMVAKWSAASAHFPRLGALAEVTSRLGRQALPVAAPVPTRDGQVQVQIDSASIALQPRIDGTHLDVGDAEQVRAAGQVLARLHRALAESAPADLPELSAPISLSAQLRSWLASGPRHVPADVVGALGAVVAASPIEPDTPIQLVHGDFRAANVLCRGSEVVAVIDFDDARLDHRVVELARSAALLGTVYHHWAPVSPEVHGTFLAGYQAVSPLTAAESAWLRPLVAWYSARLAPPGGDPAGWAVSAREVLAAPQEVYSASVT